jgi:glycosyltransferase involved in cell wall biosynthesis
MDPSERPGRWLPSRPAVFVSSFHPHLGGVEEVVRQLTRRQISAGAKPVVHTMRWPRSLLPRERWEGIDVRRHSYRVPEGTPRTVATAVAANPWVLGDVTQQLRSDRADLVHIQCVSHGAWFAYHGSRWIDVPLVVTVHGELSMDATDVYCRSPLLRHTLRLLLARADAVTACSRATLVEAEQWSGITLGDRGRVVFNGVDNAEFTRRDTSASEPRPYVLAVGRLVPQKGFDVLVDAVGRLAGTERTFNWDLIIAGDGPERERLSARVRRLGISDRVRLVGQANRDEVVDLFHHASLFVLPSRREPFGIVSLEAMAAGVPVVATDVGGVAEVVHDGVNGCLVPHGDVTALAEAIRRMWSDRPLRIALASRGRKRATELDWDGVELEYRAVYDSARRHFRSGRWRGVPLPRVLNRSR